MPKGSLLFALSLSQLALKTILKVYRAQLRDSIETAVMMGAFYQYWLYFQMHGSLVKCFLLISVNRQ